jgi:hypothetical protein
LLGEHLSGHPRVELEFPVRIKPGWIQSSGGFTCWLTANSQQAHAPVAHALTALKAPQCVRDEQATEKYLPVVQGIGVLAHSNAAELRFYRHGRDQNTLNDLYHAWRWRDGEAVRASTYHFYYLPETPEGLIPEQLLSPQLQPILVRLLSETRVRSLSGFWVRKEGSHIQQLDFSLPWRPRANDLAAVRSAAELFDIQLSHPALDLHIKHIAFRVGDPEPAITLYVSGPASRWPSDEVELQSMAAAGSRTFHRAVEAEVFARTPLPRPQAAEPTPDLDRFYGGSIIQWQAILGDGMHYHGGLFMNPDEEPDDSEGEEAMRRAVRELYPLLPEGGSVYDIGCGWGGPLSMIVRNLRCSVTGLTISRTQYRYVASLGFRVRLGDVEQTLAPGAFHAALMLESLCHVRDKEWLLRALRPLCDRVVLRVNCQDASPAGPAFGGSMHMVSSSDLRRLLERAGWRIRHWRDRRLEALPSIRFWNRRLGKVALSNDPHIETLRTWTGQVRSAPEAWARNNPLIEVMAD